MRLVPEGFDTAKAIDCSLNRWAVVPRSLDEGELHIDNR